MSLLPLAGLFLFGGKKKEEKPADIDEELWDIVAGIMSSHGEGLYQLLARASPDGDVEKIKKMLVHNRAYNAPEVTTKSKYRRIYVETKDFQHKIAAAHYPILHALLALALAHHTGSHNPLAANVVGDILSAAYQTKADYSELKKRKETLARAIAKRAKERGITADEEKTAKVIEAAFDKAFKIIDKIAPDHKKENLALLKRAISATTDDPFVVLRNAGIDIEPELEEFRQFLAEISGKKIEPQKSTAPFVKGVDTSIALSQAKLEVLSILNGLEFAGFSEEARKRAAEVLRTRMRELASGEPSEERLLQLGLYAYALEAIREGDRKRLERLKGI